MHTRLLDIIRYKTGGRCFWVGHRKLELDELLADRKAKDKELALCARLNNKGLAYEKDGNIRQAITTYEKNIESTYPAHHSFKRLMVLYRRNKDYVNEI